MKTGIESLDAGAPEITYSGNEGPKSPQQMQQMQMAQLQEEYDKYVFEMEEQGIEPMSIQQFMEQVMSEGQMSSNQEGIGSMAMKSGLIDEYRNYKMGQEEGGEQFMSPRDYYRSQEQDRAGVAYGGTANPTYTQSRKQRINAAGGGIMGSNAGSMLVAPTADGSRPGYGILSKLKDKFVDDIIPNEIKENPMLTTALLGGAANYMDLIPGQMSSQGWIGDLLGGGQNLLNKGVTGVYPPGMSEAMKIGNMIPGPVQGIINAGANIAGPIQGLIGDQWQLPTDNRGLIERGKDWVKDQFGDVVDRFKGQKVPGDETQQGVRWKTPLAIGAAMGAAQAAMPKTPLPQDTSGIDMASAIRGDELRFKPKAEVLAASGGIAQLAQGGRIGYDDGGPAEIGEKNISDVLARVQELQDEGLDFNAAMAQAMKELSQGKAQGGRIGAAEGGLMNLGGMEKDYRAEGGFVPIGGQERADDVPARLSKNEFVFTADAVRSAGGGDIDAGAEVMENLMNNLEQGGQISQESQGLEGARNMFATAQRLGEVI
jgi:hypothetical protein